MDPCHHEQNIIFITPSKDPHPQTERINLLKEGWIQGWWQKQRERCVYGTWKDLESEQNLSIIPKCHRYLLS